ncbi:hypothetical protein Barb6XT_01022 [Bacteroidales bacterium Barb6XT]|nr:hypothetical protein Barb6XT_01022 [Bacteroidales bacterium Barb6XT]
MLRATQLISMAVRYAYCQRFDLRTARGTLAGIILITPHSAVLHVGLKSFVFSELSYHYHPP